MENYERSGQAYWVQWRCIYSSIVVRGHKRRESPKGWFSNVFANDMLFPLTCVSKDVNFSFLWYCIQFSITFFANFLPQNIGQERYSTKMKISNIFIFHCSLWLVLGSCTGSFQYELYRAIYA